MLIIAYFRDNIIHMSPNIIYRKHGERFMISNTYNFKNPLLNELNARGFLYQFTDLEGIDDLFNNNHPVTFYVGFDATAKSLHVGHLLWITLVNRLQRGGHNPIILVGGGTSKIGDPTWKDTQRAMLGYETILENIDAIMLKLRHFINFDNTNKNTAQLVNNDDWLSKINYMEFLRDYGPFFSINRMLSMDSVSERLKRQQHLSFLEFNYMLLQAYDFLHLFSQKNCMLEIGGADQWSNIISGVDLIRRLHNKQTFGMTIPLLTNSDGKKMGKTEKGTVWLNENFTSPFDFWQYWRNVDDKDVIKLLKLFTDLDLNTIESYSSKIGTREINDAKIILANSITEFVHSKENVDSINKTINELFINRDNINTDNLESVKIRGSMGIDQAIVTCGFAKSLSQARRLIEGKGVKIDGNIIDSIKYQINESCVLSVGKKNFIKLEVC